MRIAARDVVAAARKYGWAGPPFDLEVLASIRGIKVRAGGADLAQDALIRPVGLEEFEILYNPSAASTRRNFSIGHEISHTFFPDCADSVHYRGQRHACDPEKPVEQLCDVGASELLMPIPEFEEEARAGGVSVATIEQLRQRYVASYEAVAIRMVTLDIVPCAAVVLTLRLKPTEYRQLSLPSMGGPEPRLRVDFMVSSSTSGLARIPKHKSIPDTSCVYETLGGAPDETVVVAEGRERWLAGTVQLPPCRIEAMALPWNGYQARALALLFPVMR